MSLLSPLFDPAREAALVTGAGNGIGRAIAQGLVGEGVRTVFADVNRDTVMAAATPRRGRNWPLPSSATSPIPLYAKRCWRRHGLRSGR